MKHQKSIKQIVIIIAVVAIGLFTSKMISESKFTNVFEAAQEGIETVKDGVKGVQETINDAGQKITEGKEFVEDKINDITKAGEEIGEAYDAIKEIGE